MPLQKYNEQNINNDLNKNKPKVLWPIISSFISLILIILITVVKGFSKDLFSWGEYIIFVIILILLPLASWFGSYFIKKQKTNNLIDYTKETEDILDYVKTKKDFYIVKSADLDIKVNFEQVDELTYEYIYNQEKSSYEALDKAYAYMSIGVGFTTLKIDPKTLKIIGIAGLLPRSIVLKRRLKFDVTKTIKSIITLDINGIEVKNKTFIDYHQYDDIYYDEKQNLYCIGEKDIYSFDNVLEFLPNIYLVERDQKIISLWIKIK